MPVGGGHALFFVDDLVLLNDKAAVTKSGLRFANGLVDGSYAPIVGNDRLTRMRFPTVTTDSLVGLKRSRQIPLIFRLGSYRDSASFGIGMALAKARSDTLPNFLTFSSSSSTSNTKVNVRATTNASIPVGGAANIALPLGRKGGDLGFGA